tara:strand:- start:613 stop:1038 length:426 start_codon:yes stop_codon:yes gene_type:complete
MSEENESSYQDISNEALQVLTAFFLEDKEGEDNELMLEILTDLLGDDPADETSMTDQIVAYQELTMRVTSLFSGMLCHVVNMVRVLAMMSMRSDTQAYKSYVEYFNYLLPTWDSVESEEGMLEYLDGLHHYFGVEIPDETE